MFARQRYECGVLLFNYLESCKKIFCLFCLWLLHLKRVDKNDFAVLHFARQRDQQRFLPLASIYFLRVDLFVARTVCDPAALPDRRADRAVARSSGAFLLPRLFAAAAHFATIFGVCNVGASIR